MMLPVNEPSFADVRKRFPQYPELSDEELAQAVHQKYYQSVPFDEFAVKIGLRPPAEDPGALQAGLIAAGRVTDRIIKGIKQPFQEAVDPAAAARTAAEEAQNTQIYQGLQQAQPAATMVGEIAPAMAALPAVGGVGTGALLGALPGVLEYGSPSERAWRGTTGAVGGAAGTAFGNAVSRLLQPFRPLPSVSLDQAKGAANRLGVDLTAGEITGSRPMQWFESVLNDMPFASGARQATEKTRREAVNRAASNAIGQNAPEVTEGVLRTARADIGATLDNLVSQHNFVLDQTFKNDIKAITQSKVMPSLRDDSIEKIIKPFENLPAGNITAKGDWWAQNKTALDTAIREAHRDGKYGKAQALEQFEKALLDAAERSMTGDQRAALATARKQWSSLRLLKTGKVVEGGQVSPARLNSALERRFGSAYKESDGLLGPLSGELIDIGKMSQTFKPLPQSGTMPRSVMGGLLYGIPHFFGDPTMGAATLAAPYAAQKFITSRPGMSYLTKGAVDTTKQRQIGGLAAGSIDENLKRLGFGLFAPFGMQSE